MWTDESSRRKRVAVFGLGSMGMGMARCILAAGHHTVGVDVDPEPVRRFIEHGGTGAELAAVADTLDAVVLVVLNAAQTEAALFGDDGIAARLAPGTVIVSCATVPPAFARTMEARCTEANLHYLDAPISGGAGRAASGELSIMAAGSAAAFKAARPVLEATASRVFELGDGAGAGSAMKAVNQMLAGIHLAAMAEATTLGLSQGIEPATLAEVIPQCAGTSWMLENRIGHVVDGDYTPFSMIDIWPKDLGIVQAMASEAGFEAPLTNAALRQFTAASEAGMGREDDAAVARVYARQAGLTLPGEN